MPKKRKKGLIGKIIYWLLLIIWTAALSYGAYFALTTVWGIAEVYEKSMPEPVVDEYVSGLNENLLAQGVAETIAAMPHEFQTDEECLRVVEEMFSGDITYVRSSSSEPDVNAYALRCEGNTFGKVYIKRDESKPSGYEIMGKQVELPWDLRPWQFYKEEFDFNGLYTSVEVTIPSTYYLQLNGNIVGPEYIVESGIKFDSLADYYSVNPDLPTKVTYRFDNIIGHLEPVVLDESGNVYNVDPERDDSQYITPCTPEQLARLDAFCMPFTEAYLKYTSGIYGQHSSGAFSALGQYLLLNGDLYNRLQMALDGLSWAHTNSFVLHGYVLQGAIDLGGGYYVCQIQAEASSVTQAHGEQRVINELNLIVIDNGAEIRAIALV